MWGTLRKARGIIDQRRFLLVNFVKVFSEFICPSKAQRADRAGEFRCNPALEPKHQDDNNGYFLFKMLDLSLLLDVAIETSFLGVMATTIGATHFLLLVHFRTTATSF